MMRLNLVLLAGVVVSALYLVNVQHESRKLYSALDRAKSQALKLEVEKEKLLVERRTQAAPARIEPLAKARLQMRAADPAITTYVTLPAGVQMAAAPVGAPSDQGRAR